MECIVKQFFSKDGKDIIAEVRVDDNAIKFIIPNREQVNCFWDKAFNEMDEHKDNFLNAIKEGIYSIRRIDSDDL